MGQPTQDAVDAASSTAERVRSGAGRAEMVVAAKWLM